MVLLLGLLVSSVQAQVRLNEFLASNQRTWRDDDRDLTDWIEIYNAGDAPVDLGGWFLTDKVDQPQKWMFPSTNLPPGEFLLVMASGQDRTVAGRQLHTNFSLDAQGEYLALLGPEGRIVTEYAPKFPQQYPDISYGLLDAGVLSARYFGVPTPGTANDPAPAPPRPVRFSRPSGTFTEPFTVTLTTDTPDAKIRYTRDGSAPDATHGMDYTAPLRISSTTRLRAVALFADGPMSRVSGVAYIGLSPDLVNYASPLPMLVIENFGAGRVPQKGWSGTGAGIKQVPRQDAFWATFDRVDGFSALTNAPQMISRVGIRGRGAYSTQWRQKPYSVEAIDEQGKERKVSPLAIPAHADWVMYFPDPDNNKDPALLFNTFAYELSRRMGQYAVRFRWVEVFLNEDGGDLRLADRRGVYALLEKVARGKHRLDFDRLSEDGTTGGWLLNLNRMDPEPEMGWPAPNGATQPWYFHTAGANRTPETPPNTPGRGDDIPRQSNGYLNFDNPNGYVINRQQRAAIEAWFKRFEDVLYNNAIWRDPEIGYRRYLDAVEFVDYFIINVLTRNGDGLLISLFPWKGNDEKLRIGPAWDYNWNAYYVSGGPTGALMHRSDRLWYARLFTDPDFQQLYIDRWWTHRRGPMSNAGIEAIIDEQVADITTGKALLNGIPSTREWANRITRMKNWLKERADWIDSHYLRPPGFNQNGGLVAKGFQLVIIATNGTIYYTTDGSDPRAPGGAVAPPARNYDGAFPLHAQTLVQARVKQGSNWSGLAAATFYPPQDFTPLAITEIMYHPPAEGAWSSDDREFIELKNTGAEPLQLGALAFTSGIQFTFPQGTRLDPGRFFVLARNAVALQSKYPGLRVDGVYTGRLANGGERLTLVHAVGTPLFSVKYDDRLPWPLMADGAGFSLVPVNPNFNPDPDNPAQWRASAKVGGSPGQDDPVSDLAPVVINEVLTHTEPPAVDAIELYNPTDTAADISHWFLTDNRAKPRKYAIPAGTEIPPGGFLVFDENDFNPTPGVLPSFTLSSHGEEVYLYSANADGELTGYSHGFRFGAAANGVSFGRYTNSVGEIQYPPQRELTLGAANAGPRVGPVVISEIQYAPKPGETEFVEFKNITDEPVSLFDPENPTNTWRLNGAGFAFPEAVTLPPQGLALVVGGDPVRFRLRHGVPEAVPVFGPFDGVLQDNGELLELQRPDTSDVDTNGVAVVPFITVDAVRYNDRAPWPTNAAGFGPSLERRHMAEYGNDPANWRASFGLPSPGLDNDGNRPPLVDAGPKATQQAARFPVAVALAGSVQDDGLPEGGILRTTWFQVDGPGRVVFFDPYTLNTEVFLPGVGTYLLRLRADDGELQISDDITMTITRPTEEQTLVAAGSVWRYQDNGSDQGTAWRAPDFDDSGWASGPAELGYGDGDVVTVVSYGGDSRNKFTTTYFRHHFQVTGADSVTQLTLGVVRDDGVVVYLNGEETMRDNMPTGDITFDLWANSAVGGADETNFQEREIDPSRLHEGENVLAVEIHQANPTSSDLSFNLRLDALIFPQDHPPTVDAGPDLTGVPDQPLRLNGSFGDDGLPVSPGFTTLTWSKVSGPGEVTFSRPQSWITDATLSEPGEYRLHLTANDGAHAVSDEVTVIVESPAPSLQFEGIAFHPGKPPKLTLKIKGPTGVKVQVQSRQQLGQGAWETVQEIWLPEDHTPVAIELPVVSGETSRFYRVVFPENGRQALPGNA